MAEERRSRSPQEDEQRRPRKKKKKRSTASTIGMALIYVIFVIGISFLLAGFGWVAANDALALNKEFHSVTITVEKDDSFGDVVNKLDDNGLIEYESLFKLFAMITGAEEKVSAGTFTLDTNMDYRALLSSMNANSDARAKVTVTIPEGFTVAQIFELLEDNNIATVEELNEIASNHDYAFSFLEEIPLGKPTRLEGYLYPDTYEFYMPHNPLYVINKMLVNFDSKFTDEMRAEVEKSGQTIHEILTIASMIEKETDGTDRDQIAAVIYNRLDNPKYETVGLLQIDATIHYITGKIVTQHDRQTLDSPYNTHNNKGLPPGPIASPGMNSIQAAIDPADTGYFYYALGDDGIHHYYKTYDGLVKFIKSQALYAED